MLIKTRSKTIDPCGLFSICLDAGGLSKYSALCGDNNLACTTYVRVRYFHLLTSQTFFQTLNFATFSQYQLVNFTIRLGLRSDNETCRNIWASFGFSGFISRSNFLLASKGASVLFFCGVYLSTELINNTIYEHRPEASVSDSMSGFPDFLVPP